MARKIKAATELLSTVHEGGERHTIDLAPFNMPVTVKVYSGEWERWYTGTYADGSCAFLFGIDHGAPFDAEFVYECIRDAMMWDARTREA